MYYNLTISADEIQDQYGLIWQRPYDTCSTITAEGKWSAAFNGPSLSLKAYWLFHALQWNSRARRWKGSLPGSANLPDGEQGWLQFKSLISAYWLSGTGICLGLITPWLNSSCLKLKLVHPLLGCLLHLNRQVARMVRWRCLRLMRSNLGESMR